MVNVYTKYENCEFVIISLFVKDIHIFRFNLQRMRKTKIFLALKFEIKGIDEVSAILSIKIIRKDGSMMLS